ncbi:hypothetical protein DPMN_006739 [Dreissena polymorpha]|uniref:Uncharacterized protein n=1 Tax=Dreissena polymorpha TaxID=45954 RepID=A0A9D4RVN1_DREPO|nr:hypothetical protein DPMN_006739 [Dreissena polymorpha]
MYGLTTSFTSVDGAHSNRTFQSINLRKNPQTMVAQSPKDPENSVILMMDNSHVIKKVRHSVIISGISKGCTRNLLLPDESPIQWQMWVNTFEWDQQNGLKLHSKLTKEHIYPSTQSKMRDHLANDVLKNDMMYFMCQYQSSLVNGNVLNGIVQFLKKKHRELLIYSKTMHQYSRKMIIDYKNTKKLAIGSQIGAIA